MEIAILREEHQWREAFGVLAELRTSLAQDAFLSRRETLLEHGFNLVGLYRDKTIVSVASFVIYPHVSRGFDCWVHDLVTTTAERSVGHGEAILDWISGYAKKEGCTRILVHTRKENERARAFYRERINMDEYAVVFQRALR